MIIRKTALCLMLLLLFTSLVSAQQARNGTAAAPYLLVPQGAKYLAGGGAVAGVRGLESVYWNPAGLARSDYGINALVSRRNFIADINVNFVAASIRFEKFGTIGIAMRNFDIGEIPVTTVFHPDGTGGIYEPTIFAIGGTYSKNLNERTSVGATVNYLNESFARVAATGLSYDIGVQYTGFMEVTGWSIGVVIRNFGTPMRYGGSGLWEQASSQGVDRQTTWFKVEAAAFDLPTIVDIGTSYDIPMGELNSLSVGVTYENNQTAQDEYKFFGDYSIGDTGALRASYVVSDDQAQLENIFASYSLGGSLNLEAFTGLNMSLDYAFIAADYFDDIQVFSLSFGF